VVNIKKIVMPILFTLLLAGCGGQGFHIKQLAKSDIDMVVDTVFAQTRNELKLLLTKLYKRNPSQLAVISGMTVEKRLQMIYSSTEHLQFEELQGQEETAAMNLAFDDNFTGDRVFALMVGLTGMLRQSYDYESDFYLFDELDPQALYNSARNIEVMAWQLKNKKTSEGRLFLITSTRNGVIDNTSFERIYGKIIHTQDIMAKIIADKDDRTLNTVIKGTLSVFLPI
jgi:hypothetical protein